MSKTNTVLGFVVTVILFLWGSVLLGADSYLPSGNTQSSVAFPPEYSVTLLDASPAASTGASTAKDMKFDPIVTKCWVSVTGTAPTSWTVAFYAGPSATTMTTQYAAGATQSDTITTFPFQKGFSGGYGARWWKVNNISTVGGDATTKYTVRCSGSK